MECGGPATGAAQTMDGADDPFFFAFSGGFTNVFKSASDDFAKLGAKKSKKSNKERATDVPSWAKGEKPQSGESGKQFAERIMNEKYGKGKYDTGPRSEYNKLKKYGDRHSK